MTRPPACALRSAVAVSSSRMRSGGAGLLRRGNGAHVQRQVWERTGSLREVVAACVRDTQG
ncbi:hypothetical protein [Streptomyces sp. NPDC002491]